MRVLQLIDSLRSGGAEHMAVNYANGFLKLHGNSFLCCTRLEGILRSKINLEVGYLLLNKKATLDPLALFKLRKFILKNKVTIIQAHGDSYFLGLMIKFITPGISLVWHDHLGQRKKKGYKYTLLKAASSFFDGIITVNRELESWARKELYAGKVRYFPNFTAEKTKSQRTRNQLLIQTGFKIIQVANLKSVKDHFTSLEAFKELAGEYNAVSLHLVGKDYFDSYSGKIKKYIKENGLTDRVFLYGEQDNVDQLLEQSSLGVLSSRTEGLPVALLEYGSAGLPVVCTAVGECEKVIDGKGKVVSPGDVEALKRAIKFYLLNEKRRNEDAKAFKNNILLNFSGDTVLEGVNLFYRSI